MFSRIYQMVYERATQRTFVYVDRQDKYNTYYLRKTDYPGTQPPKHITVTVTEGDDNGRNPDSSKSA